MPNLNAKILIYSLHKKKPTRMGAKRLNTLNEKICQRFGIIV